MKTKYTIGILTLLFICSDAFAFKKDNRDFNGNGKTEADEVFCKSEELGGGVVDMCCCNNSCESTKKDTLCKGHAAFSAPAPTSPSKPKTINALPGRAIPAGALQLDKNH